MQCETKRQGKSRRISLKHTKRLNFEVPVEKTAAFLDLEKVLCEKELQIGLGVTVFCRRLHHSLQNANSLDREERYRTKRKEEFFFTD